MKRIICKLLGVGFIMINLSACAMQNNKSPEEWFDLAWSGLAGYDALRFQGNAALLRGERMLLEEELAFSGELKDHRDLVMRTVLPEGNDQVIDGGGRVQTMSTTERKTHNIQLNWQGGQWKMLSNNTDALAQGMTRFNPLEQLEEIRKADKVITEESGAARGTKVLRIEMSQDSAKQFLERELRTEMRTVRSNLQAKLEQLEPERRDKVKQEMEEVWNSGQENLDRMLQTAKAKMIYHLTIERKSGLPLRLTSESRLTYNNPYGIPEQEVLYTDNKFTNYR